jgi:hypothetical protein
MLEDLGLWLALKAFYLVILYNWFEYPNLANVFGCV